MDRSELKLKAKERLNGKYKDAILVLLIPSLISFGLGFIEGFFELGLIGDILSIVVSALIGFGTVSYYLKVSRNDSVDYKEIFSKTDMFLSYIGITLLVGLFIILWGLLFIIPGIIAALNYSLVYYIKLDNPELGVMEVLNKSKQMINGHRWEYLVLGLSFIGWAILGVFTLGILYFWLIPYMEVTYANFYNNLKENKTTV